MRRVSLVILVYLIWEERNRHIFNNTAKSVETIFRKFQILFYTILYFHEKKSPSLQCCKFNRTSSLFCVVWTCMVLHGFLVPALMSLCLLSVAGSAFNCYGGFMSLSPLHGLSLASSSLHGAQGLLVADWSNGYWLIEPMRCFGLSCYSLLRAGRAWFFSSAWESSCPLFLGC